MNTIKELGTEWTVLDNEYDNLFQELINSQHILSPEELKDFKQKQDKLFDLETEIFKILNSPSLQKNTKVS